MSRPAAAQRMPRGNEGHPVWLVYDPTTSWMRITHNERLEKAFRSVARVVKDSLR